MAPSTAAVPNDGISQPITCGHVVDALHRHPYVHSICGIPPHPEGGECEAGLWTVQFAVDGYGISAGWFCEALADLTQVAINQGLFAQLDQRLVGGPIGSVPFLISGDVEFAVWLVAALNLSCAALEAVSLAGGLR